MCYIDAFVLLLVFKFCCGFTSAHEETDLECIKRSPEESHKEVFEGLVVPKPLLNTLKEFYEQINDDNIDRNIEHVLSQEENYDENFGVQNYDEKNIHPSTTINEGNTFDWTTINQQTSMKEIVNHHKLSEAPPTPVPVIQNQFNVMSAVQTLVDNARKQELIKLKLFEQQKYLNLQYQYQQIKEQQQLQQELELKVQKEELEEAKFELEKQKKQLEQNAPPTVQQFRSESLLQPLQQNDWKPVTQISQKNNSPPLVPPQIHQIGSVPIQQNKPPIIVQSLKQTGAMTLQQNVARPIQQNVLPTLVQPIQQNISLHIPHNQQPLLLQPFQKNWLPLPPIQQNEPKLLVQPILQQIPLPQPILQIVQTQQQQQQNLGQPVQSTGPNIGIETSPTHFVFQSPPLQLIKDTTEVTKCMQRTAIRTHQNNRC